MSILNDSSTYYQSVLNTSGINTDALTFSGLTDGVIKSTSGTLSGGCTTDDLPEGSNLYYTSARFNSAFALKTTTDLLEGSNLYYTAARFNSAFATKSTTDLTEGTNLYYTDARFNTAFSAKTTDDLTEGKTNLYYTDARTRLAISAGAGISYDSSTGVITNTLAGSSVSSITGTANQVLANGTSGSAQTGAITLTLPQSIATSSAVAFGTLTIGTGSTSAELARMDANNQAWMGFYKSGLRSGFVGTDTSGDGFLVYADNTSLKLRTSTGDILFFPGSASTETARMTTTNLMGIGESSPDLKLVVRDTVSTAQISARYNGTAPTNYKETQFGYNGASGNGYGWIQAIANGVAYTPLALNLSGGSVGIGTIPNYTLDVKGANAAVNINATSGDSYTLYQENGTNRWLIGYSVGGDYIYFRDMTNARDQMIFYDNNRISFPTGAVGMGSTPTTTNGYPTRLDVYNGASGPCIKLQESSGSGRGHIQIGSSATANNNIHIGCEGDGSFYVWRGNWGAGTQKFQVGASGDFRHDNNSGYNLGGMYGVGGSYLTLYNTNSGGYSSSIGHDGTTMYIQTGAGGNMYLQTYTANYAALAGRMVLDQTGRLSFNGMTAHATLTLFGTAAAPLAGICMGGYGYDGTPYHRLELANGGGNYHYYMSQNIVWSSTNNRWEFVSAGGWGGYGGMFLFSGYGQCEFSTATNVAGLPSFKRNILFQNDGNISCYGYCSHGAGIIGALSDVSTAFATTTTYAKLTTLATSRIASNITVSTASNRITVTLAGTYKMSYAGDIYQTSGGDRTVSVVFYKNGSVYSAAAFASTVESGKYAAIVGQDVANLAVNDYIEIWVKIDTNTTVTYNAMMFILEQI